VIIRNETVRLSVGIWGAGRSVWEPDGVAPAVEVDMLDTTHTPADVAEALGLGEAWCRSRRYLVDGRPVMLAASYVPLELAAGTRILEEDTGPGGTYARLADLGHAPARFRHDLTAMTSRAADALALLEDPGAPVLVAIRTAYDAAGRPVECSRLVYDPAQITVRFEHDA
jgi:GntR family transcriptional regulator